MGKGIRSVLCVIFTLLLVFVSACTAFAVLFSAGGFFRGAFEKTGAAENTGIGMDDLMKVHEMTCAYITGKGDSLDIVCERYDGPVDFYKKDEKAHLADVRELWGKASKLFVFCLVPALLFIFFALSGKAGLAPRDLKLPAAAAALFPVLFALLFDGAFDLFHRILFPGGNWIFYPDISLMINLYSEGVFVRCAVFAAVFTALVCAVLYMAALAAEKKRDQIGKGH